MHVEHPALKTSIFLFAERIASRIYLIRGEKVMLDSDLADLYGVETGALVRAVKRNKNRFSEDFFVAADIRFCPIPLIISGLQWFEVFWL